MHLIVTSPFAGYAVGERITDAAEVARIRAGEEAGFVVPIAPGVEPAPAQPQEKRV